MKSLQKTYEDAAYDYDWQRAKLEASQREALQQAKLEALQQALGNRGVYAHLDLNDLIDPDNKNWTDYTYRLPSFMVSPTENAERQGHINAGTPVGMLIQHIRDAKNIDDVGKQLEVWNSYKPLESSDNGTSYIRYFIPGFGAYRNTPSIGNRPIQTIAGGTGGAQGVVTGGSTQGTQTGGTGGTQGTQGTQDTKTGNTGGIQGGVAVGGTSTQGTKTGGTGSTGGMQAGGTQGGTYASPGVPKGGTKTIGYDPYDPNPGNVSLAYAMRNAPEQERRAALIDKWNQEHGISYATGKDGLIYRTDPQHPNGYVDPFKNDLSKIGSTGYATGKGMLTSGSNGTYATGEGMQSSMPVSDNWKFREAWKDPMAIIGHFGRGAFTDNEYNQLVNHAVNDLGYNKDIFSGSRYV